MSGENAKKVFTYYLEGFFISFLVSLVGIIIGAWLLYNGTIDADSIKLVVRIIYFVSTFIGGFFVGKRIKRKRFLYGVIYGVVFVGIIVIIGALSGDANLTNKSGISVLVCAIGGMLGGMVS